MKPILAVLSLFASVAFAQPSASAQSFDVADVHTSPHTANPFMSGGVLRAGRYEIHQANMVDLIRTAYGVDADKVLGGPSWLEADRFDVIAKAPASATAESVKPMLQALLADRFKLVVKMDSRPMPGFALTVGKGGTAKLKQADGSGDTGCKLTTSPTQEEMVARQRAAAQAGTPMAPMIPTYLYACANITMTAFAEGMHSMAAAQTYLDSGAVVDQTGLKGAWDFNFKYDPKLTGLIAVVIGGDGEKISLFDAIDKQLGLKLDPVKLPTPVIVVESVNRKPTDNPPGMTTSLPALPTEFEVADLRLSDPKAAPNSNFQLQPNGRIDIRSYPLGGMISLAWNLTSADSLALQGPAAPKLLTQTHIDLIAKMPDTGTPARFDLDTLRPALKALLIERFKLKAHFEDQPRDAYTLVAAKPKLKKADPETRAGCKVTQSQAKGEQGAPVSIGGLVSVVTCKNMTMAEFAAQLDTFAQTYVVYPVLDGTGLDGGWDFTLTYSTANAAALAKQGVSLSAPILGGGRGGDAPAQAGAASDPVGGVTLYDAIEKQLGLKLELHKRPEPVFVIDHIDEKPADN